MGNLNEAAKISIISSEKNWLESSATEQLKNVAKFAGMELAVGLPDLHPGKVFPIGAAFASKGWVYPQLVGNDIGCGMGLWKTDLLTRKIKLDKWSNNLQNLDDAWEGDIQQFLNERNLPSTEFDKSLGTIGGGNHFAELQKIEKIFDQEEFNSLKMDKNFVYLLVHSGSRGLGKKVLDRFGHNLGNNGLEDGTLQAAEYIREHNVARFWAEANRELIALRFAICLKTGVEKILDINHNTVSVAEFSGEQLWLHRKGAAPADQGTIVIPGSRGTLSYLVKPTGPQEQNAYSLAHGAGRKWQRSNAKANLAKHKIDDFYRTALGGNVICENKNLIFEEAPQAYKNIDIVVQDLVDAGLIKIVATMQPIISYKTRRAK